MRPTYDQIQCAAYERWERRGGMHGGDRDDWYASEKELTFLGNYRTVVEYELDGPEPCILAESPVPRCRFCERTPADAEFAQPRPVVPGHSSLLTSEICDDCHFDWREDLEGEFRRFWARLQGEASRGSMDSDDRGKPLLSAAAFKSLVAGALLMLPAWELPYFIDTLEWVSNPDHNADDRLLAGVECWVYRASFLGEGAARATIVRRSDDEAPVPYMIYSFAAEGIMVQLSLPMCLKDEDLDGREVERLERSLAIGSGAEFRQALAVRLPLAVSSRRVGRGQRASSIAS
jgi:Protein of unknown function (DUF2934)